MESSESVFPAGDPGRVFLLVGTLLTPLDTETESKQVNDRRKVVKLAVRVIREFDGKSKIEKLPDGGFAGSCVPRGWKHFDCVLEVEGEGKFRYKCTSFNPPSIEHIEDRLNTLPPIFFPRA